KGNPTWLARERAEQWSAGRSGTNTASICRYHRGLWAANPQVTLDRVLARSLNELGTRYFKIAAERRSRIGSLRYLFHEAVTPRHFAGTQARAMKRRGRHPPRRYRTNSVQPHGARPIRPFDIPFQEFDQQFPHAL